MAILRILQKQLLKLPFEQIIMLLKTPPVEIKEVISEADKFSTIDQKMLRRMIKEAEKHTSSEMLM